MKAIKENSILSFNAAANYPIDFIEFDVQVPYHTPAKAWDPKNFFFFFRVQCFLFLIYWDNFLYSWPGSWPKNYSSLSPQFVHERYSVMVYWFISLFFFLCHLLGLQINRCVKSLTLCMKKLLITWSKEPLGFDGKVKK